MRNTRTFSLALLVIAAVGLRRHQGFQADAVAGPGQAALLWDRIAHQGTKAASKPHLWVRDLGAALGTGAVVTALRRTASGGFTEAMAVPMDQIDRRTAEARLIPVRVALGLPEVPVADAARADVINGHEVRLAPYGIIARHGVPSDLKNFYILHEGAIAVADGELGELSPELIGSDINMRVHHLAATASQTLAELRAGDAETREQTARTASRLFLRSQSKTPHNNGL